MTDTITITTEFFDGYRAALLARDERAIARLYAAPALILFPGQTQLVTDETQTEEFFASSWSQYEGVDEAEADIALLAVAPGSIWADVTWSFDGAARERFCYQLIESDGRHRIAVLTPLEL